MKHSLQDFKKIGDNCLLTNSSTGDNKSSYKKNSPTLYNYVSSRITFTDTFNLGTLFHQWVSYNNYISCLCEHRYCASSHYLITILLSAHDSIQVKNKNEGLWTIEKLPATISDSRTASRSLKYQSYQASQPGGHQQDTHIQVLLVIYQNQKKTKWVDYVRINNYR